MITSCGLDEYALECLMEYKVRHWARKKRMAKMKQDAKKVEQEKQDKKNKRHNKCR